MKPVFTLASPQTGREYQIYVRVPPKSTEPGPWPVALFLDGDDQFAPAVSVYHELRTTNSVPPLLLIGVGYGASYAKPGNERGRDYTPEFHPDEPSSGGADRFLNFIKDTLWPVLQERYPVAEHIRGICGHSLGALLVLHALFSARPFFTHHLASAPSIWWADRAILGRLARLREQQDNLDARLYLSVGGRDSASMTGDLTLLEQQLAAQPFQGLVINSERFPGKNHFNVLSPAFRAGLAALFGSADKTL